MLTFKDFCLLEKKFQGTDTIYVFDIDETLLTSNNKIGYRIKGDGDWKYITPEEFARKRVTLNKIQRKYPKQQVEYDFSEFNDPQLIYKGIATGKPNIKILHHLDKAIQSGYKIGILTARGDQAIIYKAIKGFLKYRTAAGDLEPISDFFLNKKYVFAVNDMTTLKTLGLEQFYGQSEKLKAHILQKIFADQYGFKHIVFFDDDELNINTVKALNDPRITAIRVDNNEPEY